MSDLHAGVLMLLAFVCGVCWGMYVGQQRYRRLLVLIAKAGSAEKMLDGKFYYLVPEKEQT
jgi:hypothetical protein